MSTQQYISNFKNEQKKLKNMFSIIKQKIVELKIRKKEADERVKYLYDTYSLDTPEFYLDIPVAEKISSLYKEELENTNKIINNPYFGKIVFSFKTESDGDNTLYLGKKGIKNSNSEILILDWRTPIAEVYYNGKMGNTTYLAPEGSVEIDLKLKSTIKIRNGELISVYDSETVVNDDLLSEYLSQNKGTVLNEIIATIQEEQNVIIRKNLHTNLIVQGVAGSGKTTVALHRISYLLYNYRDMIKMDNVYLIAGNKLFLNYITAMLPDLDVPIIEQGIMQDILLDSIKIYNKSFKIPEIIGHSYNEIYDNQTFTTKLERYIDTLGQDIFPQEDVKIFGFTLLSEEQISFYLNQNELSLSEKATLLDRYIVKRLKYEKDLIINYISNNRNNEEVIRFTRENFSLDTSHIFESDLYKNYNKLVQKYNKYFYKKVNCINCEKEFKTFTQYKNKNYSLNDLACLLLFYLKVKGNMTDYDIKLVVIDEAQDFGVVVYYCLRHLFKKSYFTIVGDIMQNINEGGLDDWGTLVNNIFDNNAEYSKLLKSYRNTIEITTFAEKLMKYLGKHNFNIQPLVRHGQKVQLYSFRDQKEKIRRIQEVFLNSALDGQLCAILCKDNSIAEKIAPVLSEVLEISLLNTKEETLQHGIYVMSLRNSKGLEFDTVFVWDFDDYISENSLIAHNSLYVAITRALHNIYIFTNDESIRELVV